ncbi:MAG: aminopeptidase P family protein [Erysipelothrix sp.]|nr:aminopeptidase P family protein [Erysipelothrix sp.]
MRIKRLRDYLMNNNVDAILISNISNVIYFSTFDSTNVHLFVTDKAQYLITDFRYQTAAQTLAHEFEIVISGENDSLSSIINKIASKAKLRTIALEGDYLSRNQWLHYERSLHSRLVDINIDPLRAIKDVKEVEVIKEAIRIAEEALAETLSYIQVGQSERDVAAYLEYQMLKRGASEKSFATIIASGSRGSLPHGVASDKLIQDNELITIDFGCRYQNYCSDITRTVAIGTIDPKLLKIYNTVLEANLIGIEALKHNTSGYEVDRIVRDFIYKEGYEGHFEHGLGHGIGIDIHEAPRLRNDMDHHLEPGNIVTVEPGIYVDGLGGIRIEDDVLITDDGIEVLTNFNKQLIYVGGKV